MARTDHVVSGSTHGPEKSEAIRQTWRTGLEAARERVTHDRQKAPRASWRVADATPSNKFSRGPVIDAPARPPVPKQLGKPIGESSGPFSGQQLLRGVGRRVSLVGGLVIPDPNSHRAVWPIEGRNDLRATGLTSETARSLELRGPDGQWRQIGNFQQSGDPAADAHTIQRIVANREAASPQPELSTNPAGDTKLKTVTDPQPASGWPDSKSSSAGDRRRDDSCAPPGTKGEWTVINRPSMSDKAEAYQQQIAKTPDLPGKLMWEYKVTDLKNPKNAVNFDGCAFWSPTKDLLDAKYADGKSQDLDVREPWLETIMRNGDAEQAARQFNMTGTFVPVQWHVSNAEVAVRVQAAVNQGTGFAPNFTVNYTPAQGDRQ